MALCRDLEMFFRRCIGWFTNPTTTSHLGHKRRQHRLFPYGGIVEHRKPIEVMRQTDPMSTTRSFFRSRQRVFALNGQWFYATREGEHGPFATREDALAEIGRFVEERRELDQFQKNRELETAVQRPEYSWSITPKADSDF